MNQSHGTLAVLVMNAGSSAQKNVVDYALSILVSDSTRRNFAGTKKSPVLKLLDPDRHKSCSLLTLINPVDCFEDV